MRVCIKATPLTSFIESSSNRCEDKNFCNHLPLLFTWVILFMGVLLESISFLLILSRRCTFCLFWFAQVVLFLLFDFDISVDFLSIGLIKFYQYTRFKAVGSFVIFKLVKIHHKYESKQQPTTDNTDAAVAGSCINCRKHLQLCCHINNRNSCESDNFWGT